MPILSFLQDKTVEYNIEQGYGLGCLLLDF